VLSFKGKKGQSSVHAVPSELGALFSVKLVMLPSGAVFDDVQ
jgi:hypothetical protein